MASPRHTTTTTQPSINNEDSRLIEEASINNELASINNDGDSTPIKETDSVDEEYTLTNSEKHLPLFSSPNASLSSSASISTSNLNEEELANTEKPDADKKDPEELSLYTEAELASKGGLGDIVVEPDRIYDTRTSEEMQKLNAATAKERAERQKLSEALKAIAAQEESNSKAKNTEISLLTDEEDNDLTITIEPKSASKKDLPDSLKTKEVDDVTITIEPKNAPTPPLEMTTPGQPNSEEMTVKPKKTLDERIMDKQWIGQEFYKLITSWAIPFTFRQVLSPAPLGIQSALDTTVVYAGGILGDMLAAATNKRDPFSGLRAEGAGKVKVGLAKTASAHTTSLVITLGAGYGLGKLIATLGPRLLANPSVETLGQLLMHDSFGLIVFGPIGYGLAKGLYKVAMKIGNRFVKGTEEIKDERDTHLLQKAGGAAIGVGLDLTLTEAVIYLARLADKTIASDPTVQTFYLLTGVNTLRRLMEYFSYTPQPITSLAPKMETPKTKKQSINNTEIVETTSATQHHPVTRGLFFAVLRQGALAGGVYLLTYATCKVADSLDSSLCKEDSLANRMERGAIVLGTAVGVDFVSRYIAAPLASKASGCFATLFNRFKNPEKQPLLLEAEKEQERTFSCCPTFPN